jgi:uncharacterized protein
MMSPERSCIGCRRRREQAELIRFTLEGARVVPAGSGSRGRSAYLCPDVGCLDEADKRRAFARAFRGPVTVDVAALRAVARRAGDEGG